MNAKQEAEKLILAADNARNEFEYQEAVNELVRLVDDVLLKELEATERKLAEAEKVINNGLMTRGIEKPYRVTICNTFYPKSAMGRDVTLCVDVTDALKDYEASKGVRDE